MLTTYPERLDLTVIVLTLNEADHIERCLITARQISRQLLVLDSGSEDATIAIAQRFGARTSVRAFDGYANQRNVALEMVDSEWVLFLDADEWVTGQLAGEIHDALTSVTASINGFWIPRENRFGNRPLRGGGWWPDRQLRLFRRASGRYDPAFQVHERLVLDGGTGLLDNPLIHENFADLTEFRATQRRYLPMLVEQRIASGDLGKRRTVVGRPTREFWRRFITLRGYRDGWLGAVLALMMAS
jgi:glycosyltransferase involved in cell wall biosynthesis